MFTLPSQSQKVTDTVAEVLSEHGVPQLHVAETEKYAHVTYFFNGGREEEWPGRHESSCRRRGMSPAMTTSPRCRPAR